MSIEPMSTDRMRHIVGIVTIERQHAMKNSEEKPIYSCREDFITLIKRWAEAEARAREGDWGTGPGCPSREKLLAVVLQEIGWPNE